MPALARCSDRACVPAIPAVPDVCVFPVFLGFASPPFVPAWPVVPGFVAALEPAVFEVARLSGALALPSTLLVAVSVSGCNTLSFLPRQPMSHSVQNDKRAFTEMDDMLRHDLKAMSAYFK